MVVVVNMVVIVVWLSLLSYVVIDGHLLCVIKIHLVVNNMS